MYNIIGKAHEEQQHILRAGGWDVYRVGFSSWLDEQWGRERILRLLLKRIQSSAS